MPRNMSMCIWCNRAPRAPHLPNCPELTGIPMQRNYAHALVEKRTGARLRRARDERRVLPLVMFLAETRHDPDTPAALYHEDTHA